MEKALLSLMFNNEQLNGVVTVREIRILTRISKVGGR